MENCKKCVFYDAEFDKLRQSGDDIIFVGSKDTEKHYCRMYESCIAADILSGAAECEHHISKESR